MTKHDLCLYKYIQLKTAFRHLLFRTYQGATPTFRHLKAGIPNQV